MAEQSPLHFDARSQLLRRQATPPTPPKTLNPNQQNNASAVYTEKVTSCFNEGEKQ